MYESEVYVCIISVVIVRCSEYLMLDLHTNITARYSIRCRLLIVQCHNHPEATIWAPYTLLAADASGKEPQANKGSTRTDCYTPRLESYQNMALQKVYFLRSISHSGLRLASAKLVKLGWREKKHQVNWCDIKNLQEMNGPPARDVDNF